MTEKFCRMAQKSVMNSNAVSRDTGSNLIVKIPATFLATTADLQSLDLSHNLIQDLSDCPFESLTRLKKLDLSRNKIKRLGPIEV